MTTLAQQIEAELDRREAIAEAAAADFGEPTWTATPGSGNVYGADQHENAPVAIAAWDGDLNDVGFHIALHDPADALRRYAAARRVLARHRAIEWYEGDVGCWYCSGETDSSHRAVEWPCPDLLDLADSLGLSTTTSEEQRNG